MPTGTLSGEGKKLFEKVYQDRLKACKDKGGSEDSCQESAAKQAWSAVKGAGYSKDKDGNWHKSADLNTFSLTITKASYDKATNEMRWQATASDTQDDLYEDNMSLELFEDFIERIDTSEPAPEDFRSAFWVGGMPYLSISHYPDLDGKAVPGTIEAIYIDGDQLKSKGTFSDTPLGRACFKAVNDDLYGRNKSGAEKVRISIAFIDWKHRHKDSDVTFERKTLDDACPECFKNLILGILEGKPPHPTLQGPKEYLRGQLIHEAMTRVPVNTRTLMEVEKSMTTRKEDAESIVGELVEEIEKEAALVGKSEALVIKADAMLDCAENESEEDCRKRMAEVEAINTETKVLSKTEPDAEKDCADDDPNCKGKKKDKMGDEKKSDVEVLEALAEIKSMLTKPVEPHPLDAAFAELRSQFDAQVASGAGEEDVLRALQVPYSAIGDVIKAAVQPKAEAKPSDPTGDALSSVLQSVQQLSQQVGLLSARLDGMAKPPTEVMVPQRRQISPQALQKAQVDTAKSGTSKLRELINRTTY